MKNESYWWNFGAVAYVQVDVFFEKYTQPFSWIILDKIKEISKNFVLRRFSMKICPALFEIIF